MKALYVESWVEKRKVRSEEKEMKKKILMIVANDLNKQLRLATFVVDRGTQLVELWINSFRSKNLQN
jgi:hypothetical protein